MSEAEQNANEITQVARQAKETREAVEAAKDNPTGGTETKTVNWKNAGVVGLGVGLGSAALAGALLYAGRRKKKK